MSDRERVEVDVEHNLIEAAKAGDVDAFGELYRLHRDDVACQTRSAGQESEDLVQEVFVRAFEKKDTFKDRGRGMGPWLGRIAVNTTNNHWRQLARRRQHVSANQDGSTHEAIVAALPSDSDTEAEALTLIEVWDPEIDRALVQLRSLNLDYHEAFKAVRIEGLTTNEYARKKGVKPATVRTRLHRASEILRSNLAA